MDDVNMIFSLGRIRVKYLDKEDIEELGWKFIPTKSSFDFFKNGDLNLHYLEAGAWYTKTSVEIYHNDKLICALFIKNKSELKKIMKMVGIL